MVKSFNNFLSEVYAETGTQFVLNEGWKMIVGNYRQQSKQEMDPALRDRKMEAVYWKLDASKKWAEHYANLVDLNIHATNAHREGQLTFNDRQDIRDASETIQRKMHWMTNHPNFDVDRATQLRSIVDRSRYDPSAEELIKKYGPNSWHAETPAETRDREQQEFESSTKQAEIAKRQQLTDKLEALNKKRPVYDEDYHSRRMMQQSGPRPVAGQGEQPAPQQVRTPRTPWRRKTNWDYLNRRS